MARKEFLFIRLAAVIAAAVLLTTGFPVHARADGKSPVAVASADGSGSAVTGEGGAGKCFAELSGQQICCHRATLGAPSDDATRPRGDDKPVLTPGYASVLPPAVYTGVSATLEVALPPRIPRFLLGGFRS